MQQRVICSQRPQVTVSREAPLLMVLLMQRTLQTVASPNQAARPTPKAAGNCQQVAALKGLVLPVALFQPYTMPQRRYVFFLAVILSSFDPV